MTTFRQPDRRSCGAAVLVRARMLAEPAYDAWVRDAEDPAARFADEVLRTHRRTNRPTGGLPWPRTLGTLPWALARELPGGGRVALALDRQAAWRRLVAAGAPAALYVGTRWLPRHVVLVTGGDEAVRHAYEPSSGCSVALTREAFADDRLRVAGWDVAWFTVIAGRP